jgi:ABC-type spermidine/putrescine transport system permease subunit I
MALVAAREATSRRRPRSRGRRPDAWLHAAMLPSAALLGVLVVAPLGLLVYFGFTKLGTSGLSLDNYSRAVTGSIYPRLLVQSLLLAIEVSIISVVIGWPAGWALAKHVPARVRTPLLAATVIPFLTSYLLLIYGMLVLLQPHGPLMALLSALGLASEEASILYTPTATLLMLVYESLPLVVLVLYAASERLDDRLLDAARSLGAGRWQVFRNVIWPLTTPSLIASFVLTFVPTAGAFVEAEVLGGPNNLMLGNVVNTQVTLLGDLPFGAALSLVLLVAVLVVVAVVYALPKFRR